MSQFIFCCLLFLGATPLSYAKDEPKLSAPPTPTHSPTPIPAPAPVSLAPASLPELAPSQIALPTSATSNITPLPPMSEDQNTKSDPVSETHMQADLPTDSLSKEIGMRKLMLDWSRHLGVTCNFCHDTNNFKNDEKLAFKVGLKHKSLVRLLNEEVFTERDKGNSLKVVADCYMCHRGSSTPQFREPPQKLLK